MILSKLERKSRYIHKAGPGVVEIDGEHICGDGRLYYDTNGVVYHPDGKVVRKNLDIENDLDLVELPLVDETSIKYMSNDCWHLNHVKTFNNGSVLTIHAVLRDIPRFIQNGNLTVSIGAPDEKTSRDPVLIAVNGRMIETGGEKSKILVFNHIPKPPNAIGVLSFSATLVGDRIPSEYIRILDDNLNFIVIDCNSR